MLKKLILTLYNNSFDFKEKKRKKLKKKKKSYK